MCSPVKEVKYKIWYQDNDNGWVPGPSDYRMKIALKTDAKNLNQWVQNESKSDTVVSLELWESLQLHPQDWPLMTSREVYLRPGQVKVLFREQGILLLYYTSEVFH
ncbi:hypothetical protein AAG747_03725 [Rapidithrix thailandica]|uniref:Uncharacterized protein n=1 Tax=Rapidithrix thailandica TaxID=413964 RepID=A0AAW9RVA7_9BACT